MQVKSRQGVGGSYLYDPGGHLGISDHKGISLKKPAKTRLHSIANTASKGQMPTVHKQALNASHWCYFNDGN